MNKVTRILLALGLILAVATPALAEFKLNGYYRLMGYSEEKKNSIGGSDEADSQQFIDQRFRAKLTYTLNDNVSVVYFAEVDTTWGENNKAAINEGGMSNSFGGGADGVNVETKNVYLDLKYGDTNVTLGIQGVADAFESIVANDDMAAVQVVHKIGNTTLKGVYSKWDEDDFAGAAATNSAVRGDWDDFDFWVAEAKHKFNDNFTAGAGVYFMDDNNADGTDTADAEIWFYGLNGDVRFGNFGIDGFVMLQDGEFQDNSVGGVDTDLTGLAASVKGRYKLENGDLGLRVIYFQEADDDEDVELWQGFKGQYAFVNENQMQFLTDKFVCNDGKERYAEADSIANGFGLLAFVLSGNHKLPQDAYLNWGLGYYMAADDQANIAGTVLEVEDQDLGYEVALRVGKKFFEKVDVSLNASYADYGDFYEDLYVDDNGSLSDPDATYKAYMMVNVPF